MSELEVAAGFAPVLPWRFRLAPQCQVLARLSGPRSAAQWSLGPSHLRPETNSPGMCSLRPCAHQKSAGGLAHERELTLAGKSVRCRRSRFDRHLRAVQHDLCDIPYKQIMHGRPSPLWPTSTCQRHLPFRKHREPSARPLEAVADMLPLHSQTCRLNFAFKSTMAANVPKPPYSMHSAHTTPVREASGTTANRVGHSARQGDAKDTRRTICPPRVANASREPVAFVATHGLTCERPRCALCSHRCLVPESDAFAGTERIVVASRS